MAKSGITQKEGSAKPIKTARFHGYNHGRVSQPKTERIAIQCQGCQEDFLVSPLDAKTARFCSVACRRMKHVRDGKGHKLCACGCGNTLGSFRAEQSCYLHGHKACPQREIVCSCGCEKKFTPRFVGATRIKGHHRWSLRIAKKCEICGKKFFSANGGKRRFCSNPCKWKALSTILRGRKKRSLPSAPGSWLRKHYFPKKKCCQKCGWNKQPEILQIHHKDLDRSHNEKSNLLLICPNCHAVIHFKSKTGPFDPWKNRRFKKLSHGSSTSANTGNSA